MLARKLVLNGDQRWWGEGDGGKLHYSPRRCQVLFGDILFSCRPSSASNPNYFLHLSCDAFSAPTPTNASFLGL